jgi:hypothetical protein
VIFLFMHIIYFDQIHLLYCTFLLFSGSLLKSLLTPDPEKQQAA